MMILDKGYFDYDFTDEKPRKPINTDLLSREEVANILSGALIPGTNKRVFEESAEDLQKLAMEEK